MGSTFAINCYNTALMSRIDEVQGQLYFPTDSAQQPHLHKGNYDLMIALFHHPYNWLEANNSRIFKKHVERTSDLILTGHEHEEASRSSKNVTGEHLQYLEGAALQEQNNSSDSGFNVIICDLDKTQQKIFQFTWKSDRYLPIIETQWQPLLRNESIRAAFENNIDFSSYLQDAGTGFTHPRTVHLRLRDIFVYPDLSKDSPRTVKGMLKGTKLIPSNEVLPHFAKQERSVILGGDQAGKTALARMLYTDLQSNYRLVPVLVSGTDIAGTQEELFLSKIYRAFEEQYSTELLQNYKGLPSANKVLIVDNWDKTKLNGTGQKLIIEFATRMFGKVICLASDLFRMGEMAGHLDPFKQFDFYEIREFGNVLRGRLIDKWETLGREETADPESLAHEIHEAERLIRTLLGKNLLPSYPVIILSVLQTAEAGKSGNAQAGSYGYLYEVLITSALAKVSKGFPDLNAKNFFISRLAYYLFQKRQTSLTRDEVRQVTDEYFQDYGIRLNEESILGHLETAHILYHIDGNYKFTYSYYYYYYVARFLADNLRDKAQEPAIREQLRDMADKLYFEQYGSILMFVVYMTRDAELIEYIVTNANQIYSRHKPCDFEQDVDFINRLYKEAPKVLLPSTSLGENVEEHRSRLDADAQTEVDESAREGDSEKVKYSDDLNDIIKINIAFKTLQLMGQILRNFAGSLRRDLKTRIAQASYSLGLRTLNAVLKIAEVNLEEFRSYLAALIKEHRTFDSERTLEKTTDEALLWLTRRCAYAVIKRVSYSVGQEMLVETYKAVVEAEGGSTSVRLIDLSVKLDHFSAFPETKILEMSKELRKNFFASTLLRDMVANYLYLFPVDRKTLQRMGSKLKIETYLPPFIENRTKKIKRAK